MAVRDLKKCKSYAIKGRCRVLFWLIDYAPLYDKGMNPTLLSRKKSEKNHVEIEILFMSKRCRPPLWTKKWFRFFTIYHSRLTHPCVWQRVKYECHCEFFPLFWTRRRYYCYHPFVTPRTHVPLRYLPILHSDNCLNHLYKTSHWKKFAFLFGLTLWNILVNDILMIRTNFHLYK